MNAARTRSQIDELIDEKLKWEKLYRATLTIADEQSRQLAAARTVLAAERLHNESTIVGLEQQLAAGREEKERWQDEYARKVTEHENTKGICDILNEQLAAERKGHEMDGKLISSQESTISTLVEALNEIANSNEDNQYLSRVASDALAKVKK